MEMVEIDGSFFITNPFTQTYRSVHKHANARKWNNYYKYTLELQDK